MFTSSELHYGRSASSSWLKKLSLLFLAVFIGYFLQTPVSKLRQAVSQELVAKAFHQSIRSGERIKPWFWADTWPMASISFPNHNEIIYVLAGSEESTLIHGPGHVIHSAFPGQIGKSIIVSASNSYFDFFDVVKVGELIEVMSKYGRVLYQVNFIRIMNEDIHQLDTTSNDKELLLMVPYQANHDRGATLHYLVSAVAIER